MTGITMHDRYGDERLDLDVEDYLPIDNAYPTSRVLSRDSTDSWAAEEWAEEGVICGLPCVAIYLFSKDEVSGDGDQYPWDTDHIERIIID